ncbi:hypothetical protein HY085_02145 [Candidatus Gottesmanbacteria bacterium]|nr:hypothetical protein [Candidatus Gottesmanbacteria bacterium]
MAKEKEINAEIKKFKKRSPSGWLNNFSLHLPGHMYHYLLMEPTRIDKQFIEVIRISVREGRTSEDTLKRAVQESSELYLNQTPREFFAKFDSAIKEAGLDTEKFEELLKSSSPEKYKKMNDLLEPVYKLLRLEGYNDHDLTT